LIRTIVVGEHETSAPAAAALGLDFGLSHLARLRDARAGFAELEQSLAVGIDLTFRTASAVRLVRRSTCPGVAGGQSPSSRDLVVSTRSDEQPTDDHAA
jgi:hypothetical protein